MPDKRLASLRSVTVSLSDPFVESADYAVLSVSASSTRQFAKFFQLTPWSMKEEENWVMKPSRNPF